jgi:acetyl esterase/lipase
LSWLDVPNAFAWLAAGRHPPNTRGRAGAALDLERVVLVGHSAGGHLALWAAARGAFEPSRPFYRDAPLVPRGVIGLGAVADLAAVRIDTAVWTARSMYQRFVGTM